MQDVQVNEKLKCLSCMTNVAGYSSAVMPASFITSYRYYSDVEFQEMSDQYTRFMTAHTAQYTPHISDSSGQWCNQIHILCHPPEQVFQKVMPYDFVGSYQHFRQTCYFHFYGRKWWHLVHLKYWYHLTNQVMS